MALLIGLHAVKGHGQSNPDSIYQYLQRKQKLEPYFGLKLNDGSTEWVKMGIYYLTEWGSRNGSIRASFTARDVFDVLSESQYKKSRISSETSEPSVGRCWSTIFRTSRK
jgi:hypothetical protein